jgi:hypothetical protein
MRLDVNMYLSWVHIKNRYLGTSPANGSVRATGKQSFGMPLNYVLKVG